MGALWKPKSFGQVIARRELTFRRGKNVRRIVIGFGRPVRKPGARTGEPWWAPAVLDLRHVSSAPRVPRRVGAESPPTPVANRFPSQLGGCPDSGWRPDGRTGGRTDGRTDWSCHGIRDQHGRVCAGPTLCCHAVATNGPHTSDATGRFSRLACGCVCKETRVQQALECQSTVTKSRIEGWQRCHGEVPRHYALSVSAGSPPTPEAAPRSGH